MNLRTSLDRVRRMDAAEARFRANGALRTLTDRARYRLARPAWDASSLQSLLELSTPAAAECARRLGRQDMAGAQDALRQHFSTRRSPWPVAAARRDDLSRSINHNFPDAQADAKERADRILAGSYDLLGYRDLNYGSDPDWHLDVVHGRRAPAGFWADVPFLEPANGDHKITWELNRHQHWLALGRACWLTGDAAYARACLDQLYSWLASNPPLEGINWASMLELAFRSISWTWALEFFAHVDDERQRPWIVDLLVAIDRQLDHVAANLSRYFSPNTHLSGEALALYVVSLMLPELKSSARRCALGREVLLAEAHRQVFPDGGHAERSTHYHRYSTDFYLLAAIVARNAGDSAAPALAQAARRQAEYLRTVADDAGQLQMIGDDDGGQLFAMCGTRPADVRTTLSVAAGFFSDPTLAIGSPTEEAAWLLGGAAISPRNGSHPRSRLFQDSGYFVSRVEGQQAILDGGPHGFLNGGHAHADALSLIASIGGRAVLIDPGTGTYTMDPQVRDALRSGRLHNTVLVDGVEHSRPRGPFHWIARADARFAFVSTTPECDVAQALHDGYDGARHVRTLFSMARAGWLIVDQILGTAARRVDAFWHVHPQWAARRTASGVQLTSDDGCRSAIVTTAPDLELTTEGPLAIYAPEYGAIGSAPVLRTTVTGTAPLTIATFVAATPAAVDVMIELAGIVERPAADWTGAAVSLRGAVHLDAVVAASSSDGAWSPSAWGSEALKITGRAAVQWTSGDRRRQVTVEGARLEAAADLAPALHGR